MHSNIPVPSTETTPLLLEVTNLEPCSKRGLYFVCSEGAINETAEVGARGLKGIMEEGSAGSVFDHNRLGAAFIRSLEGSPTGSESSFACVDGSSFEVDRGAAEEEDFDGSEGCDSL